MYYFELINAILFTTILMLHICNACTILAVCIKKAHQKIIYHDLVIFIPGRKA